jgi:hypothetical protein
MDAVLRYRNRLVPLRSRSRYVRIVGCAVAVWLALLVLPVCADGEAYRPYLLRHQPVRAIEPQLLQLIRDLRPEPHVLLDESRNQILLRGPWQAHEIAQQFLQSVDRPALPSLDPPVAEAASQAVVHGYGSNRANWRQRRLVCRHVLQMIRGCD